MLIGPLPERELRELLGGRVGQELVSGRERSLLCDGVPVWDTSQRATFNVLGLDYAPWSV